MKIWIWGSQTIWYNIACNICFLKKKTPPYCPSVGAVKMGLTNIQTFCDLNQILTETTSVHS